MSIVLTIMYFILGGLPNCLFYFHVWENLKSNNYKIDKFKKLIFLIILSLSISVVHDLISDFIRIILILVLLVIVNVIAYRNDIKESIVLGFYSLIMLMIAELLFGMVYIFIMNNSAIAMLDTRITTIIMNLIISLIAYLLYKIPILKNLYKKLYNLFSKLSNSFILIFAILILFSVNFLFLTSYYKIDIQWLILINTVISTIYLIIVFKIFSVENKFIKINAKYNTTLNSLKEYEDILDKYKIMNHENKNDLLMIRNMILKKEKDVDKYIDKLIDVKIKDDEKLMYETSIIPSGGLRAVIYSKLLIMKNKKIKNTLCVDKSVRRVDLTEYSDDFVLDLCKVISIFIDNAIETTSLTKKKEVLIELFLDSKDVFNISVSNTYKGTIDLSKIDSKGYTTKGDSHGYGLALAAELLNKHKQMKNVRKITNKIFTQTITIEKNN